MLFLKKESVMSSSIATLNKKSNVYIRSIRYQEVCVFLGAPLLGVLFSVTSLTVEVIFKMGLLVIAVMGCGCSVIIFNDIWGKDTDKYDERKSSPLLSGEASSEQLNLISFAFLAVGFSTCIFFPMRTLISGAALAAILNIYSHPYLFLKGKPGMSSLAHFISGMLLFLVGYSIFKHIDLSSVLISIYFGIIFTAGHMNHEIKDYTGDRKAGVMTNAVRFGRKNMLISSFVLFSLSTFYFYILGLLSVIPEVISVIPFILYPSYCVSFFRTYKRGMTFKNMCRFRRQYRIMYGIIGTGIGFCLLSGLVLGGI